MALGLTQKQASKLFGLTAEGYNRIETGKKSVPVYVDTILFISSLLNEEDLEALKQRRGV